MIIIHEPLLPAHYRERIARLFPRARLRTCTPEEPGMGTAYRSICGHPDIYITRLDHRTFVLSPSVFERISLWDTEDRFEFIKGASDPGSRYPLSASYNALSLGGKFFHALDHTDPVLLSKAHQLDLEMVEVAQGYTRCSCVPVGEKEIVTSDGSIARSAEKMGFDTCFVDPESILLPGQKHGLIGGTCGKVGEGHLFFCGDPLLHPWGELLLDFCERKSVKVSRLEGLQLYDCGSLFFL